MARSPATRACSASRGRSSRIPTATSIRSVLKRFLDAYQSVELLTIGELWAVAITLRIVLIENLRRITDELATARRTADAAEALADRALAPGFDDPAALDAAWEAARGPFLDVFGAQLAKRLRDQDPTTTPALVWLERRLEQEGLSIDAVVQRAQQRQGAANVTTRNIITSMRAISSLSWADFFESVSAVDATLRAGSAFAANDFPTRNLYRNAIEALSRGSGHSEVEVAKRVLRIAAAARTTSTDPVQSERYGDPGYHLIAEGRPALENVLGFVPPLRERLSRFNVRLGIDGYVIAILALSGTLVAVALALVFYPSIAEGWLTLFTLFAFIPISEAATAIVGVTMTRTVAPVVLPALELTGGPDVEARTLIAIPTLLTNADAVREQVAALEVHHLSGTPGEFYFALVSDWTDSVREQDAEDFAVLAAANDAVARLNERYGAGPAGPRFVLLHRRRIFDACEDTWMGWERKRGKLHELDRLLRGATDTTFLAPYDRVPEGVRYVVTLDADTRLPRDAALRLVGKMRHPLNRPFVDPRKQRVTSGYAILQPRVSPSLVAVDAGSIFQTAFSGPGGIDPYAGAVSDIYQDLAGEGSYVGKGIYDVDAFEAAMAGRVPDDTMLSHDLFEGVHARAGLASDIEVIEDFPTRYEVAIKRLHRWTRGDWQLLPWVLGHWRGPLALPSAGRWKMLDNLRRSMLPASSVIAIGLCWLLPPRQALIGQAIVVAALAVPSLIPASFAITPRRGVRWSNHLRAIAGDLRLAGLQILLSTAFLADRGWRLADAIVRTLYRMVVSRRRLLEWTTAAQAAQRGPLSIVGLYREMAGGCLFVVAMAAAALAAAPRDWPVTYAALLPLTLLWLVAPFLARWSGRPTAPLAEQVLSSDEQRALRLIARRTWRYFETFVTADENMLPPDNFQEVPRPVVARRTSPTNIGLYLLSCVVARDFGWAGTTATLERIEATFATLRRLVRFNGHFYNWYDTRDLRPLEPAYVSSVDSGNLAGHLIALANACDAWRGERVPSRARGGLVDTLDLAKEAVPSTDVATRHGFAEMTRLLADDEGLLERRLTAVAATADRMLEGAMLADADPSSDVVFWLRTLRDTSLQHRADLDVGDALGQRLDAIAAEARAITAAMDFRFLLDPERKLLSIGYSLADNRLDSGCYDLLASEARLASIVAIAKGDAPAKHWFRLGRATTPVRQGIALMSWSGSMFEYLMPSLVLREPSDSLLAQSNRMAVARQRDYAASRGVPWGISESAFNARDFEFTYQYSNFGVPGLGLKRGLEDDLVIAPYATGLASMVDPRAAIANYRELDAQGARGRFGFHESIDYTRSRLPQDARSALVRNFMAHHQGMTIVAIGNALTAGAMRRYFHTEPMIVASELLLQERPPRDIVEQPPVTEAHRPEAVASDAALAVRRLSGEADGPPATHLLSNGRYSVMATSAGGGYSRWRDIAITRWREDPTRDADGSFIYLRDLQTQAFWSAATQPCGIAAQEESVVLGEDHVVYERRDGRLTTTLEVLVSGEDDGEVRRLTLVNRSRRPRDIELTSYAELVLTTVGTDAAHPAFAKMFVETEYAAALDALIATRRPRSPDEAPVWAAHFAVVQGEQLTSTQYETDRLRFIGRGGDLSSPAALAPESSLSCSVGTVLDPVFALRHRVRIPPGDLVRVAWWTMAAASRDELVDMIDRHRHPSAFDRAMTLAWTQAQIQLRHLDVKPEEAATFQQATAPILYADARFRSAAHVLVAGAGPQSRLWPQSISGDLPIVVARIDDPADMPLIRQLLRAHEYWRARQLAVDVVIVNERAASYTQDLQQAIDAAVRSSQSRPSLTSEPTRGGVYSLRADLLQPEARMAILAAARLVLVARRGPIGTQLAQVAPGKPYRAAVREPLPVVVAHVPAADVRRDLEFFNGLGGFGSGGREYVVLLEPGRVTPAPWIDVVSNPRFGFQASADGSGFTWAENSRENPITPWSNDAVRDPAFEAFYVRDETLGRTWTPTALPIRDEGTYIARHGFGYVRFEHEAHGIALDLMQFVPIDDPVKVSRLTITNRSTRTRRLTITGYVEWALAPQRAAALHLQTEIDPATGAMFARNPWTTAFPDRVAFFDLAGRQRTWTGDRTEFLGRRGSMAAPAALQAGFQLSGTVGAGLDPCGALQYSIELRPGRSVEVVGFLGQCVGREPASALVERWRAADLDAAFAAVERHWNDLLGAVRVRTPNRALDILLNGWLLYQVTACRIYARSAFYQASGAYGFRDQLQDGMALTFARPDETRAHLLRASTRQFVEGDVQHWWLPHSGQGVRTHISDDRVWLAYAVATYVGVSGDVGVLDETVPFLEGPPLDPAVHDRFDLPLVSDHKASIFEHCARGLDQCIELTGAHGLPLMGTGDWNDGMNHVGQDGRGESVWLAWLFIRTIALFAPHADARDPARAARWRAHAESVRASIERDAWDGAWYRRATFDDGTWLGSKDSDECRIDSIAQSWAVLSDVAQPERTHAAMESVREHLIREKPGIALLFTPPFDRTTHDPGYIKGYPPGLRENGGQYSHAAMWLIFAYAKLGDRDRALALFDLLNPINHARTPSDVRRYKVEPYVVAADVYSVAPHEGRGGWTWYTGSAAWMYRGGVEALLGITREGAVLRVAPRLPSGWNGFEATVTLGDATIEIVVEKNSHDGPLLARLDGVDVAIVDGIVHVPIRPGSRRLAIEAR